MKKKKESKKINKDYVEKKKILIKNPRNFHSEGSNFV